MNSTRAPSIPFWAHSMVWTINLPGLDSSQVQAACPHFSPSSSQLVGSDSWTHIGSLMALLVLLDFDLYLLPHYCTPCLHTACHTTLPTPHHTTHSSPGLLDVGSYCCFVSLVVQFLAILDLWLICSCCWDMSMPSFLLDSCLTSEGCLL